LMPLFRRGKKAAHPALKQMKKMMKALEKGKKLPDLEVRSRQEIVTDLFVNKIHAVGLEPSADSGYVPVSHTPLARFLRECGLADDMVEAIMAGIFEEESEDSVREIIQAAAETPDINLTSEELAQAQELAVEEWRRKRKASLV